MLCATLLVASAVGQSEENELGGTIGRVLISDQGIQNATPFDQVIHSGKGVSIDVEYARRIIVAPIYSLAGEVVARYSPDEALNGGAYGSVVVPTDYRQLFITPAARVHLFPTTAVSPWLSFGGGFGHFSQSKTLVWRHKSGQIRRPVHPSKE